jgi:hypothetical protein
LIGRRDGADKARFFGSRKQYGKRAPRRTARKAGQNSQRRSDTSQIIARCREQFAVSATGWRQIPRAD